MHLRGHNLVISKAGGDYQHPRLLKTKSMKKEIKVTKTDDQPMTTIKDTKNKKMKVMKKMIPTSIKTIEKAIKKEMNPKKLDDQDDKISMMIDKMRIANKEMRVMMEMIPTSIKTIERAIEKPRRSRK